MFAKCKIVLDLRESFPMPCHCGLNLWPSDLPSHETSLFLRDAVIMNRLRIDYTSTRLKSSIFMRCLAIINLSTCPSVRPSVCHTLQCIVSKRLYINVVVLFSPRGKVMLIFGPKRLYKIPTLTIWTGALNKGRHENIRFQPISPVIAEAHRSLIGSHRYHIKSCHFRWPWKAGPDRPNIYISYRH